MDDKFRVIDLFSGIGGFSLGLEAAGMETVAFCEIEEFPVAVLKRHWPEVPVYNDVKELTYEQLKENGIVGDTGSRRPGNKNGKTGEQGRDTVDTRPDSLRQRDGEALPSGSKAAGDSKRIFLLTSGFPCQPFSVAGHQRAQEDDRHLWPEIVRILREFKEAGDPIPWGLFENVAGLIRMGLDACVADLESLDYSVRVFNIPACAKGALHRRSRIWVIANHKSISQRPGFCEDEQEGVRGKRPGDTCSDVSDTSGNRPQGCRKERPVQGPAGLRSGKGPDKEQSIQETGNPRSTQPRLGRKNDGLSQRLHEIGLIQQQWEDGTWEDGIPRVITGQPDRVNRLKALGNAVVPQIVKEIGLAIMTAEKK